MLRARPARLHLPCLPPHPHLALEPGAVRTAAGGVAGTAVGGDPLLLPPGAVPAAGRAGVSGQDGAAPLPLAGGAVRAVLRAAICAADAARGGGAGLSGDDV